MRGALEPNKAQITYKVGSEESVLRFHTVVAEEHEVSAEITKFPVQAGYIRSNHSIKKNRRVVIKGIVSNHLITGSRESHNYGGNNSRQAFLALKSLVRNSVVCKVDTNLDVYDPVVFTKLSTKQGAGTTDILDFTMIGEEIQLGSVTPSTTPTIPVFRFTQGEEKEFKIDLELFSTDCKDRDVKVSTFNSTDGSFAIGVTNEKGKAFTTTYVLSSKTVNIGGILEFQVQTSDYQSSGIQLPGELVETKKGKAELGEYGAIVDSFIITQLSENLEIPSGGVEEVFLTSQGDVEAGLIEETSPNPLTGIIPGFIAEIPLVKDILEKEPTTIPFDIEITVISPCPPKEIK